MVFEKDRLMHDGISFSEGAGKNGKPILTVENYRYYISKREPEAERITWRCAVTNGGTGRLWSDFGHTYVHFRSDHVEHCLTNATLIKVQNIRAQMRKAVTQRPHQGVKDVYTVFATALNNDPAEAASIMPAFDTAKTAMYRRRAAVYPKQPDTLADLQLPEQYRRTLNGDDFIIHDSGDHSISIFGTDDNIKTLAEADQWWCDGTFSHIPKYYHQMWTIHCLHRNKMMPMVYAFLTSKMAQTYVQVFRALKEHAHQLGVLLQPTMFRSDFETGLFPAIAAEFPNAESKGSHLHYCQAIYRKVQQLGLTAYFQHDEHGQKDIRYLMAIPFLRPNEVIAWFDQWQANLPIERQQPIQELLNYYRRQWLEGTPIERWNMHMVERRTNNNVEGFHSGFNKLIGLDHRHLYKFLSKLQKQQALTELTKHQIAAGQVVVRPTAKEYERINKAIDTLTRQYHIDGDGTALVNGVYRNLAKPLNIAL